MSETATPQSDAGEWGRLEIMGHRVVYGRYREVRFAGADMVEIAVPLPGSDTTRFVTTRYGGAAIFSVTSCAEALARKKAAEEWQWGNAKDTLLLGNSPDEVITDEVEEAKNLDAARYLIASEEPAESINTRWEILDAGTPAYAARQEMNRLAESYRDNRYFLATLIEPEAGLCWANPEPMPIYGIPAEAPRFALVETAGTPEEGYKTTCVILAPGTTRQDAERQQRAAAESRPGVLVWAMALLGPAAGMHFAETASGQA